MSLSSTGSQNSPKTLGDVLYAKSAAPVTEQEWVILVRSIAAGDQLALHALYERSHRLVFTLMMRITANRETAEELTIDVFHDVWRHASRYDAANGTVLGWMMNQARSRAIDRVRYEQRKKRVPPDDKQQEEHATAGPADAVDERQQREQLHTALSELTPDERVAIETAFFSELTYSETATKLDQPLGTVKTRVRSALAKLRKALGDRGES